MRAKFIAMCVTGACGWDSELTNAVVGKTNAKRADEARAAGKEHWEELGVGVDANGKAYGQAKPYGHIPCLHLCSPVEHAS